MFLFLAPTWLWALPLVAAAGAWGLWRARKHPRPISSARLWRTSHDAGPAPSRRRLVDPVWLLVWIASLLAALALAHPAWSSQDQTPAASTHPLPTIHWALRSLPASPENTVEAWVQSIPPPDASPRALPQNLTVRITPDQGPPTDRTLPAADLQAGAAFRFNLSGNAVTLALLAPDRELAHQRFTRPSPGPPFGLIEIGTVPPDLRRVFEIQPHAHPGDPSLRPAVLLVGETAPQPAIEDLARDGLLIAGPSVPLPGIQTGPQRNAPPDAPWTPTINPTAQSPLASLLHLNGIHISSFRNARITDPAWEVIATVDNSPWIAAKPVGKGQLIWFASDLSRQSDWPRHPSFVVFFAQLADQLQAPSQSRFTDWIPTPSPPPQTLPAPPIHSLTPFAGLLAIFLLLAAVSLLVWRAHA